MTPYYADDHVTLLHGDALDVLRGLGEASIDAVVTDPPYGLEFMGRDWDGADGFRRSLNAADVGRDSVFGRTSATSPEYRTGDIGKAKSRGMSDGRFKGMTVPESYNADVNVKCGNCRRWKKDHAERRCVCSAPDFPNVKAQQANVMQEWHHAWAVECLRVLKPGGHLLAFGGTRTYHRLTCAIEDAGFEIRDSITWIYGSGFPKSLDVSKAIDKAGRGAMVRAKLMHFAKVRGVDGRWLEERGIASAASFLDWTVGGHVPSDRNWQIVKTALEVTADEEATFERAVLAQRDNGIAGGTGKHAGLERAYGFSGQYDVTAPATDDAARWAGWGTALKPAHEPIVVARKPLAGTVAQTVIKYGTGAINVDGCRVGDDTTRADRYNGKAAHGPSDGYRLGNRDEPWKATAGRWPSNALLDEAGAAELDRQSGVLTSGANPTRRGSDKFRDTYGEFSGQENCTPARGLDSGGASRFFPVFRYEAKADTAERPRVNGAAHPTVKPLGLMRWLVRLVTPPGGLVLDPFAGSGTTAEACIIEGFRCIAVEKEPAYLPLIVARLSKPLQPVLIESAHPHATPEPTP